MSVPKFADDRHLASMQVAMDRLAEYVAQAERGDIAGLADRLEQATRALVGGSVEERQCHPNQIILGAALFLANFRAASGRSAVPLLKEAPRLWDSKGRVRKPSLFVPN